MAQCSLSISTICQPLTGLSSTETGLNGEHAVLHKLLRFYILRMSVDIVMLPELLGRSSFICLSCQGVGQVFFFFDTSSICTPCFIFTRTQFANADICISCKVKLLSTAQSLIFQDSKGSRRL